MYLEKHPNLIYILMIVFLTSLKLKLMIKYKKGTKKIKIAFKYNFKLN